MPVEEKAESTPAATPEPEAPADSGFYADTPQETPQETPKEAETPEESATSETPEPEGEKPEGESVSASEAARSSEPKEPSKAERRIKQLTARIKDLEKQVPRESGKPPALVEPVEPDIDEYQTVEEYRAALKKWNADTRAYVLEKDRRDKEEKAKRDEAQKLESEIAAKWSKNAERVKKQNPDFNHEELIPEVQPNATTHGFLAYSDYGPEILNHLAENPDDAERIRGLDPYATARELWKLHDKFHAQNMGIKQKPAAGVVSTPVRGKAAAPAREKDLADVFYN